MLRTTQGRTAIDYEPDEKCPPFRAIMSALQIFIPNTISLVMLASLVVRASDESDAYLSWVTFTVLAVTGAGMILQTLKLRQLGSGRLIVANFNVPFLAVCALALSVGGPGLLASLVVVSTLVQSILTLRLASLRRIFTQTVSGIVVMLVAVSAMPFIISRAVTPPEGESTVLFLVPGMVALAAGVLISLQDKPVWRMWILTVTVVVGLIVAAPLGFYDADIVADARWVSLPPFEWPGRDLVFNTDFWALLPVFVFVNLTAFMKAVGDLSVIYRASYRAQSAVDFRTVQGGFECLRGGHPHLGTAGNSACGRTLVGHGGLHCLHGRSRPERRDLPGYSDHSGRLLLEVPRDPRRHSQSGSECGLHHHLQHALHRGCEDRLYGAG